MYEIKFRTSQVHNNKLKKIPKSIGELSKLVEFYIQNNELTYLPNVENVKKMKILKISDEQESDSCELFEAELEGETVLSCSYFSKFCFNFTSSVTLLLRF